MISKKINLLSKSLKDLGLYRYAQYISKLAESDYQPGILYFGDALPPLRLSEASPQDVTQFIQKAKELSKDKYSDDNLEYKERYVEEPYQSRLIGDKIKLPWQVTQNEAAIQFFENNFPDLFDLDVDKTRNWIYENIRWPEVTDSSSRSSGHMFDLLNDEVEDLIREGKNQAYIQDFIRGYYASLQEANTNLKADFSGKSKAWQHGYNARRRATFSGDVMKGNSLYQSETAGRPSFDSDLQEQSERGISSDIMEGERYIQSDSKDFDQAVGEWFLTHGNLDGIIFDQIEEAKRYSDQKAVDTATNENFVFNHQSGSGMVNTLDITSKNIASLVNDIKNNFAMMEAERERIGDRKPKEREEILVGNLTTEIVGQVSRLMRQRADNELTMRAISSEVAKKKAKVEEEQRLLAEQSIPDNIKGFFLESIEESQKKILELEENQRKLDQILNTSNQLLSDIQQRKLIS